ncbi:OmpW/AlkL family protein [Sphingomonas montana]|uniref:OmpW/AlkL family protein n=1 Tax=Sphingomonas montana TaxID=1843236 RepID=UPI00096F5E5C|nr:OmpW family outer membrane protein [Sphingomonas montana]
MIHCSFGSLVLVALCAATAGVAVAGPAAAQDAPTAATTQASVRRGIRAGDALVRVRAIMVAPNERSGSVLPTFPGERVRITNSVMPEIDATYMATDHVGFELIAATTRHRVDGRTGTTGSIGKLASTWVLPPTLTAQYHFNPRGSVRPYVGAGLNYTIFWNEAASKGLERAAGSTGVRMRDSFGWAAQAGIDVDVTPRMFVNLDVKYIDIDTSARLRTTAIGTQTVRVGLDPLVFGIGLGLRL